MQCTSSPAMIEIYHYDVETWFAIAKTKKSIGYAKMTLFLFRRKQLCCGFIKIYMCLVLTTFIEKHFLNTEEIFYQLY